MIWCLLCRKMRRSAAPSMTSGYKKAKFVVPYAKTALLESSESVKKAESLEETVSATSNTLFKSHAVRSTEDVLKLITEPLAVNPENEDEVPIKTSVQEKCKTNRLLQKREKNSSASVLCATEVPECDETDMNESLTSEEIYKMNNNSCKKEISEKPLYYNVLWCKRSGKKHKKWEGDAILIIKSRTAVLKDLEGKEIGRGMGYKAKEISSLEEGSSFYIGGKECEIQNQISEKDYSSGSCFLSSSSSETIQKPAITKKLSALSANKKKKLPVFSNALVNKVSVKSNFNYSDTFFLPRPTSVHQWAYNQEQLPVTDVVVDPILVKHLRPHQKDGIIFMYECISGFRNFSGHGAILADEMGLGKTLQCIALIWTLLKQGPYGGKPLLRKVLIITPGSLVKNWQNEFFKWLGKECIPIFAVSSTNKVKDFTDSNYKVLIISYEMFLRSAATLKSVQFDLVICDEGHRLKNLNIKTSSIINGLLIRKRILLTGTPIQNDLEEFFSIVEFVNPGILGTINAFRKLYQDPIIRSRSSTCIAEEKDLGQARAAHLSSFTGQFVLRRTLEVINKYLPPKFENVVFCRPTSVQIKLYKYFLNSRHVRSLLASEMSFEDKFSLACISTLRKLCNHPSLMYKTLQKSSDDFDVTDSALETYLQSAFHENDLKNFECSGKMNVLVKYLDSFMKSPGTEKIVLVSNFTQMLDIMEEYCQSKNYYFLRLDGSTTTSSRQNLVDTFNMPFSKHRIFLLSAKAGGVGLNLTGASHLILYDIDWNPATDLQAMARIWRDGQKYPVFVYRLLTAGTIEEKIYQRQISKQGLSGTIIDTALSTKSQFSMEDLKDLFVLCEDAKCLTHDLLQCPCTSAEELQKENIQQNCVRTCQLGWMKNISSMVKNTSMSELLEWNHIPGPISESLCSDIHLTACGKDITFLFMNKVNCKSS